jgi:hypothetical protein
MDAVARNVKLTADGALHRPEFARHRFAHDGHPLRIREVRLREIATFKKGDAHDAEIPGRDGVISDDGRSRAAWDLITGDFDPIGV